MSGERPYRRNNTRTEKRTTASWLGQARTGLRLENIIQTAADQDNCRRVAHDATNPRTEHGYTEQNRAYNIRLLICTQNVLHQVCTIWVIQHLVSNLVYLVQLDHCTIPGAYE